MSNLPPVLKSRKFWAAVMALALVLLRSFVPNFPITDERLTEIVYVLISYIIGTGLSDIRVASAK
jgi:hypothetical protein